MNKWIQSLPSRNLEFSGSIILKQISIIQNIRGQKRYLQGVKRNRQGKFTIKSHMCKYFYSTYLVSSTTGIWTWLCDDSQGGDSGSGFVRTGDTRTCFYARKTVVLKESWKEERWWLSPAVCRTQMDKHRIWTFRGKEHILKKLGS